MEEIISLCKRRGFIYQGSEIYGGLAGTWDYGPLGVELKRNIVNLWWETFVKQRDDMYGVDTSIIMNPKVWQASGHVETFSDPLIEDTETHERFRLDHLLEDNGVKDVAKMTFEQMTATVKEKNIKSPKGHELGNAAKFNMMFKTNVGPVTDETSVAYLRPETAQGMFTNFKNILDSFYPDLPFGLAQEGRTFRNEISPRDFIFRSREFEIMELEYFINSTDWEKLFEQWREDMLDWFKILGIDAAKIKEIEVPAEDRAHYSKRTIDFYYDWPGKGFDEIGGLAYRTDFDLLRHQEFSGKSMEYRPKNGDAPFVPHVIEPTFGVTRHVLMAICDAFTRDGDRVFLKFPRELAPIKVVVSPLLKNKPELVAKAREVYEMLKKEIGAVTWDDSGNIGKRYAKADEIGVPHCVVVDFDSLENDDVTVRDRDTTEQVRVKVGELVAKLQ
jgi:glycyl-tRNA synthetase